MIRFCIGAITNEHVSVLLGEQGETKTYLLMQDFAIFDLNKVALKLITEFIYWWTNPFIISDLEKNYYLSLPLDFMSSCPKLP